MVKSKLRADDGLSGSIQLCPKSQAVSMDRCNTCLEFTGRSFKAQSFSWTLI
jgi:hypothetical protein